MILEELIGGDEATGALWWDEIYDNILEVETSQDWAVPADVTEVTIGICGGGGGNEWSDNGGGGSGMTYHTLAVTPEEIITIAIGLGGDGAADGGTTSFGGYQDALGGLQYNGASKVVGRGSNGGGSGGSNGGNGNEGNVRGESLTFIGAINGVLVSSFSSSGTMLRISDNTTATGGAGGGLGYETYGHGAGHESSTDGICVIWY